MFDLLGNISTLSSTVICDLLALASQLLDALGPGTVLLIHVNRLIRSDDEDIPFAIGVHIAIADGSFVNGPSARCVSNVHVCALGSPSDRGHIRFNVAKSLHAFTLLLH